MTPVPTPVSTLVSTLVLTLALTLVLALVLLSACALELPHAPYFETSINVPLGRERITGWDLADDNEFLFADSTGDTPLRLFFEGAIDSFRIADRMDVVVPEAGFSATLEQIALPDPDDIDEEFRVQELTDLTIPEGGTSVIVSPFSIPPLRRALPLQESFFWLRFQSGRIDLRVRNLLPVPLGVRSSSTPALGVRLLDPVRGDVLLEAEFDRAIAPGAVGTLDLDLEGIEIQRRMELEVYGESPGSDGESVFVRPEHGLDLRATFRDVEPDSAVASVPAQRLQLEDTLDIDLRGDLGIVGGSVSEGRIPLTLTNQLPVTARGTLTFAELDDGNEPVTLALELPAARSGTPGRFEGAIELTSRAVRSLDGEPIDRLTYNLDIETDASVGVVALGRRQKMNGFLGEAELRFSSVDARPEETRISIPQTETALDLPEEVEDLELVQASLTIVLESTIPFPSLATVILRGISGTDPPETPVEIPIEFGIEAGTGSSPTESSFEVTEANSDLLRLIRSRPSALEIEGEVRIGTDGRTATVERGDWIHGRYEVAAPLRVRVGTYEREVDEFDFSVSSDLQERIRDDVVRVVATGQVENHFPLAAETRVSFASSLEQLERSPEVELDLIRVEAGAIDPRTGRVDQATLSQFEVTIPEDEIPFFGRDRVFGRLSLRLLGDSLSVVELSPRDFTEVSGVLEFRIGVGEESAR